MDTSYNLIDTPNHYTWHPSGVETKTICEEFSYHAGTAMAYIWRHGHKGTPVGDLKKAIRHLTYEIERLERGKSNPSS